MNIEEVVNNKLKNVGLKLNANYGINFYDYVSTSCPIDIELLKGYLHEYNIDYITNNVDEVVEIFVCNYDK